ncbi:gamma-glutamyl cyclotransferase, AIG2-like domain-containing protein [Sarocladium implicatum]|nr:gamma-glutamyl cyclotransferase, AIG2-like domain-containing protein [Sarocladium implicatum]
MASPATSTHKEQAVIPSCPLFIYGSLCAKPILAWALTGNASLTTPLTHLIHPARAQNIARYALNWGDYPAAVREPGAFTLGYLFRPETHKQRSKLDEFEGETYKVESVKVQLLSEEDGKTPTGEEVEADIYLWNGEKAMVSDKPWDLEWFIENRVEDWIDVLGVLPDIEGEDSDEDNNTKD